MCFFFARMVFPWGVPGFLFHIVAFALRMFCFFSLVGGIMRRVLFAWLHLHLDGNRWSPKVHL